MSKEQLPTCVGITIIMFGSQRYAKSLWSTTQQYTYQNYGWEYCNIVSILQYSPGEPAKIRLAHESCYTRDLVGIAIWSPFCNIHLENQQRFGWHESCKTWFGQTEFSCVVWNRKWFCSVRHVVCNIHVQPCDFVIHTLRFMDRKWPNHIVENGGGVLYITTNRPTRHKP